MPPPKAPKRNGRSPKRVQSLGDRSNAIVDRVVAAVGLPRAAVERAAVDRLARDAETFRAEVEAERAAREWLALLRAEYGGPVQRPQLHLRDGKPLTIRTREGESSIPGTTVIARHLPDGRFALNLRVTRDGQALMLEALRVADVPEAIVPLSAVHVAPVVAPSAGEVARQGPTGRERVVFGDDGVRRTYVGDELLPNRVARFG